ncbi:hypothetical protein PFISCL1PPCAC_28249, partial [Pristionchus fissidentatus]
NRTIADLWEIYASSSDKYQKKLSELWKNKKLGLLIDSASNGSLLLSSSSSSTIPPHLLTSTSLPTTRSQFPTTTAVSPRTIKVINILRRLLPDYIPQLSSIFGQVRSTFPAATTTPTVATTVSPTTFFVKKSSFKRPSFAPNNPQAAIYPTAQPTFPSSKPAQHRLIHRMAPRLEHRTAVAQSSTPSPFYAHPTRTATVHVPYTPQFPIASLDPKFSPSMKLPDAL